MPGMSGGVPAQVLERAARVRLLALDVDGVLTDGMLHLGDNGVEYKSFYSRDGHGLKLLMRSGVEVAVITGRRSKLVSERMASLGVTKVYQGRERKLPVFLDLLDQLALEPTQTAYVGDDVVDLPVLRHTGLAIAVADADPRVVSRAHWCTRLPGGRGAVREVCDLILQAQGRFDEALSQWLE